MIPLYKLFFMYVFLFASLGLTGILAVIVMLLGDVYPKFHHAVCKHSYLSLFLCWVLSIAVLLALCNEVVV